MVIFAWIVSLVFFIWILLGIIMIKFFEYIGIDIRDTKI